MKYGFKNWSRLEIFWLFLAIAIVTIFANGDLLDLATAVTNVVYIILMTKRRSSCFCWGLVGMLLYAYTAHDAGFYGRMAMCILYYLPMNLIGLYLWCKNTPDGEDEVTIRTLSSKSILILDGMIIMATGTVALILSTWTTSPHPIPDAFVAISAVIAKWLMVNRYSEQWIVWIGVYLGNIYLWSLSSYSTGDDKAIVAMWVVFLITGIYGAYLWLRNKEPVSV